MGAAGCEDLSVKGRCAEEEEPQHLFTCQGAGRRRRANFFPPAGGGAQRAGKSFSPVRGRGADVWEARSPVRGRGAGTDRSGADQSVSGRTEALQGGSQVRSDFFYFPSMIC